MPDAMNRRRFIKLASGLLVAAPVAIAVEPVRRFWQVGTTVQPAHDEMSIVIHKGCSVESSIPSLVETIIRIEVERFKALRETMAIAMQVPPDFMFATPQAYESELRRKLTYCLEPA